MRSLLLEQSRNRANGDGRGSAGTGEVVSHIPSQGDVALPIPGVSGGVSGSHRSLECWGTWPELSPSSRPTLTAVGFKTPLKGCSLSQNGALTT